MRAGVNFAPAFFCKHLINDIYYGFYRRLTFTIDRITVFAVNVINAKVLNVSNSANIKLELLLDVKELSFSFKLLNVLLLCLVGPKTRKEMLLLIGATYQTNNVRNIINPLVDSGCLVPIEEDRAKTRGVKYELTERGREYLKIHSSLDM